MAILNFQAASVAPNTGFDPLPAGWYNAKITDSELKPTKDGTGEMLALTFEILDGQYANRKVFTNLNLKNKNPVAVNIAYADLSAICHVAGVVDLQDSQQLHERPLQIKLKVKEATEQYDAGNEIRGYRDQYGRDPKELVGATAQAPQPTQPMPPAQPGATAAPPAPPAAPEHPQEHIAADGTRYLLINNEWVAQAAAPAPAAPPAPPVAPTPPGRRRG